MKVAHIVTRHFGSRYGADANIVNWMDWERKNGHDVVLIAGGASPATGIPGVRVRIVNSLVRDVDPVNDLLAFRAIRSILTEERPDIVHTHHSKAGILGRLAVPRSWTRGRRGSGPRTQVVHTVHMVSFGPAYGRASALFLGAERLCGRRTAEFVAVGEELRERYLAAGVGSPEHFRVVRSPAGVERFLATRAWSSARRAGVRAAFGLTPEHRVVVAAGLLEERKRQSLLIDRLAPVLAEGNAVLVLAGDGPLRDQLSAQVRRAGLSSHVRMVGYVPQLEGLFAVADVLVHAATVEGVPQTVLQALAAGVPVVATAVEGLREVPGDPITIVDGDGTGLAAAVQRILAGQVPPVVEESSMEPWTVEAVAQQISGLYGALLQRADRTAAAAGRS